MMSWFKVHSPFQSSAKAVHLISHQFMVLVCFGARDQVSHIKGMCPSYQPYQHLFQLVVQICCEIKPNSIPVFFPNEHLYYFFWQIPFLNWGIQHTLVLVVALVLVCLEQSVEQLTCDTVLGKWRWAKYWGVFKKKSFKSCLSII